MTMNQLASLLAKREGRKHQATIGDIREILKLICVIGAEVHYLGHASENIPAIVLARETARTRLNAKRRRELDLED